MSTKIYDAYRYTGTLHQLTQFLFELRRKMKGNFVDVAVASWAPKDFDYGAFVTDLRKMLNSGVRVDMVDGVALVNPACSAVVYPVRIGRKDSLLVQFFGFSGGDLDKLLPKGRFKDFHYQNQTDYDAPEREWSQRKRVWAKIFKAEHSPAAAGLTFDLISESAAYEFAVKVGEKLHGHKMGEGAGCEICAHRREIAEWKKELSAK